MEYEHEGLAVLLRRSDGIFSKRRLKMVLCAASIVLLIFAYALLNTPGWYRLPQISESERQKVRNNLVAAEQAFTESLRGSGTFVYHIYAEDVNRWIAMRKEIYPLIDELAPPQLADPQVCFESGTITLAGRYSAKGVDWLISFDILASCDSQGIVLTAGGWRCGSVPMPSSLLRRELDRPIERERGQTWPGSPRIWGSLRELHVGAEGLWKNGGMDYRVLNLAVHRGQIDLTVEPLGRHASKRRKAQD